MKPNNIHVAYLRRIEETLAVRSRRRKLVKAAKKSAPEYELIRIRNKHRACITWERDHAVVI